MKVGWLSAFSGEVLTSGVFLKKLHETLCKVSFEGAVEAIANRG